jgi:hypothetical protein
MTVPAFGQQDSASLEEKLRQELETERQHQQNATTTAVIDRVQAIGSDTSTLGPNDKRMHGHGNWVQVFERRGDG